MGDNPQRIIRIYGKKGILEIQSRDGNIEQGAEACPLALSPWRLQSHCPWMFWGSAGQSRAWQGLVLVFAGLKELQRSLPASASHCGLVALSTEDVKALGRDGFPLRIGCRSLLLLGIIE